MAYGAITTASGRGLSRGRNGKLDYSKPIDTKIKSISYSTDTPDILLDLSTATSVSVTKTAPIKAVKVRNDGYVPSVAIFTYSRYSAEDTVSGAEYVQYLLNPNDEIILPTTRAIIADSIAEWDGTVVTATAPDSNEYVDSGADVDDGSGLDIIGSASETKVFLEPYTDADNCTANLFYIGDLIRVNNEIMEVTAIGNKTDLANNYLTVRRGEHGSTAASDHADDATVRLPFFNAYHDFDKYSVAQTDDKGRFKAQNFFGYGRSATAQAGVTLGSVAIQFYSQGYQGLGLSDLTSNTESGLTASTAYALDIQVDGGTNFDNLTFTVDSSNTKFGGSDGIIAKIQAALNTQYYTAGNLFEKKVTVGIENGDLVFRSGSYLSTSAIALTAEDGSDASFFGTGRIPAVGNINAAVAARLEPETTFDSITNTATYKQIFIRDDGNGNLIYKNERIVGTINYESGAIDWTISERPNAEFVVSVLHSSPFSGRLDPTTTGRLNSLRQVLGNTPQQKCEAILTVETF